MQWYIANLYVPNTYSDSRSVKYWENAFLLYHVFRILWKWQLCHHRLFRNWCSGTFTSDFTQGIFTSEEWLQHCHW